MFYGRIKGISDEDLSGYVKRMIQRVGLEEHADKPSGEGGGGRDREVVEERTACEREGR